MPNRKPKQNASTEFLQAEKAARFVLAKTKLRPRIALVLGSGLGEFADEFENAIKIPYAKIPYFPQSTAIGHAGQLVLGKVGGIAVHSAVCAATSWSRTRAGRSSPAAPWPPRPRTPPAP